MPWPTEAELERFDDVLARQKPEVNGKAYNMQVFENELPRDCGDPWRGAYAKHGFWYKFKHATRDEFEKIVALSFEQDEYLLRYDNWDSWRRAFGENNIKCIVAKNLKDEVMGGIVGLLKPDGVLQIAAPYVQQEFRHSGIGSKLLEHITKGHEKIVENGYFILNPKISIFTQKGREYVHVVVDKPSGFTELKESIPNGRVVLNENFTADEWKAITTYDEKVSGEKRDVRKLFDGQDETDIAAAFSDKGDCLGYLVLRHMAGGFVKRLLVGPWYSEDSASAEALLRVVLAQFYNPEEDFDFDPDVFAVYRRDIHFIIPTSAQESLSLLKRFAGSGTVEQKRLKYQTFSSYALPTPKTTSIFAVGDMHSMII